MTYTSLGAPRLTWRAHVQKALVVLSIATLAAGAAACGGKDSSTEPTTPQTVAGEYLLETIQAKQLPVKIYDGPIGDPGEYDYFASYVVTIKRGAIDLDDAGNYHLMIDYHLVRDGEVIDDSFDGYGTYQIDGNRIFLTREDGEGGGDGPLRSGQVTIEMNMVDEGDVMPYVFRK
ncbi:MAG TPA: hypothetical protein VFW03_26625 [Gemmatimonadaceae bacterium]|nr:hypothetical protein [Gemmatimonadaceae bacterium]